MLKLKRTNRKALPFTMDADGDTVASEMPTNVVEELLRTEEVKADDDKVSVGPYVFAKALFTETKDK
jgi:hypothetical protein